MTRDVPLLSDDERQQLTHPERINIGNYHTWKPVRECAFVVDLLAQPLVTLVEAAGTGRRVYEFMSIRRPGDVLRYLVIRLVDVDEDVLKSVAGMLPDRAGLAVPCELPFGDFDRCFNWDFDDSPPHEQAWLEHREGSFWSDWMLRLLGLVCTAQARLRHLDDYLLRHELRLIDSCRHRRDFLANPLGRGHPRPASGWATPVPEALRPVILDLIRRDDVHSVSCPFDDFALWRGLIEEQLRRAESTGLPLQRAFGLSGPDSGLSRLDTEDWGGEVHIPYHGTCGADLFILPSWHRFFADKVRDGGKLRWAVAQSCHHVLSQEDHGELACATRHLIGDWTLYTSTAPYENCNPFLAEEIERVTNVQS